MHVKKVFSEASANAHHSTTFIMAVIFIVILLFHEPLDQLHQIYVDKNKNGCTYSPNSVLGVFS